MATSHLAHPTTCPPSLLDRLRAWCLSLFRRPASQSRPKTRDLLAQCAFLLNKYGPDAPEVDRFIDQYRDSNPDFVRLAEVSRDFKRNVLRMSSGLSGPG
jgi:hypothetical protein